METMQKPPVIIASGGREPNRAKKPINFISPGNSIMAADFN
jgi:hypothetical protein